MIDNKEGKGDLEREERVYVKRNDNLKETERKKRGI
jgi:hypothetical protein